MVVLSQIMTKGGDGGYTSLGNNERVPKSDQRIAMIGVIDELNSAIGVVIAHYMVDEQSVGLLGPLQSVQHDLFDIGADLSMPWIDGLRDNKLRLQEEQIVNLERFIEEYNRSLEPINSFVLPGGTIISAYMHMARTICRRAERTVVTLVTRTSQKCNPAIPVYLNRLSDLLFIFSRIGNNLGKKDVLWEPGKNQDDHIPF